MLFKDVPAKFLESEDVMRCGFSDKIMLYVTVDQKIGIFSWIIWVGLISRASDAENFLWLMAEGKSGREEAWDGLHTQLLLWRWRGPRQKGGRQLWRAEGSPQLMAGKETGPHPYSLVHSSTRNCVLSTTCKNWEVDSSLELPDERPAQ